jgi:mono/diheme cytochrome c family protein
MYINFKRVKRGLAGLALLVLAACTYSLPQSMIEEATVATGAYASNGERIYFTGASANDRITYTMEGPGGMMGGRGMMGGSGMMSGQLACANCHGPDGRGGRFTMGNLEIDAPDIRWSTLTEPGQMDHPPYTVETFERAVTQGIDPGGNPLDPTMPRWQMSEQDLNDLIAFLVKLSLPGETPAASTSPVATPAAAGTPAASIIGDATQGSSLFEHNCAVCHGPLGTDHVPNPGSDDGVVPALNPIDPELFNKDPQVFANNIDPFLQHGSTPDGPDPTLKMPAFGDAHTLTQPQIADLEAYVLQLNGVDRAGGP